MPIASFEEENKLIQETAVPEQSILQGMSGFLVKKGLAANQTSADLTLLVLAGLIVVACFFVYYVGTRIESFMPDRETLLRSTTPPPNQGRGMPTQNYVP